MQDIVCTGECHYSPVTAYPRTNLPNISPLVLPTVPIPSRSFLLPVLVSFLRCASVRVVLQEYFTGTRDQRENVRLETSTRVVGIASADCFPCLFFLRRKRGLVGDVEREVTPVPEYATRNNLAVCVYSGP